MSNNSENKTSRADDIEFARSLHNQTIPYWSTAWHRIGNLQRAGLLRVRPIHRWSAKAEAVGDAAP
jgi:hypothetical protein